MNKKKFYLFTAFCAMTFGTIFIGKNYSSNTLRGFASDDEIWGHYSCVEPTFMSKGIREYWISCNTHVISYTKPNVTSSQIEERNTLSQSFIESLSDGDSRLLPKYKVFYDFEDGVVPHEFEAGKNTKSLTIDETSGTRDSKCLKAVVSGSDYFMGLSKNYLDAAFADTDVKAIKFDAKGTKASSNFRHNTHFGRTDDKLSNPFESSSGIDTNWKTFYFTRNMFNEWKTDSTMLKGGEYSDGDYLLIDNIELTKYSFDSSNYAYQYVGFETGKILDKSSNNTSIRAGIGNKQIGCLSGAGYGTASFDYTKHTEGNRSLCIPKVSGYLAIFTSANLYNSIDDNGILVDIYTDFDVNSISTVNNFVDGKNGVFNLTHRGGKWTTYHLLKSQITTDGRILIFQGSPTGNIYIDNIRPATGAVEDFSSSYSEYFSQYATSANYEVTSSNYNTIRDSYKTYNVIVNGANISDTSISLDHPENWHHKSMKVTYSGSGYCAIMLNPTFLTENFDNGISLDIYTEQQFTAGTAFSNQVNKSLNTWQTITLLKEDLYDPLKPGQNVVNGRIFGLNFLGKGSFYIDNIRAAELTPVSTCSYSDVDFESGNVTSSTSGTITTYSYNFNSTCEFRVMATSTYLNSVSLEDAPFGRTGKALKVSKNNGYVAFYLNSGLVSNLGNNDLLSFDLYSTIGANSTSSANNFLNNNNSLFVGENYSHVQNRWITYKLKKSDIGSDGRFLIIQGSTAGDWYFDNLKVRSEKEYFDLGTFYPTPGSKINLNLGKSVPANTVIKLDGNPIYYDNNSNNTISLYVASICNGEHILSYKIYDNKYSCKEYSYYFASYKETSLIEKSVTLTYGNAGYQTIDNIPNVGKVVCNNNSIAYERNGTSILIPDSSLIECLETVNNSKTSGKISLKILSGSMNSTVTAVNYNIKISGSSNVKEGYTNYSSNTFELFGYSSTGAGTSRNLNYEEQLMEYKRSGLENVYEQFNGLPIDLTSTYFSNYHYNDNRNYQDLVRCDNLGIGCIVADEYTNKLCDETSSIIGRSITLSSKTTVNFSSTADLYNALYSRYSLFSSHTSLKQIVLCDEPRWQNLDAVGEVYRQARKVMDDLGRTDVKINVNLLPISAGYGADGMGDQVSGLNYLFATGNKKRHDTYINYLNKWLEKSGADYVQYDIYPLNTKYKESDGDNKYDETGLDKFSYINLITASEFCKSKKVELRVVSQTCTLANRSEGANTRIMSADDLHYLNNMLMGFGVKNISYFTYYARHNTEEFNQMGSMMLENTDGTGATSKTSVWYDGQTVFEEMNNFAKIIQNFDYVASNIVKNGSYVEQGEAYSNADEFDSDNFNNFGVMTNATIDNGYGMFTAMKDGSGKYMFMVQNVCDPLYDARVQNVSLKFSSGTYAQIFENGTSRFVNLTSGSLSLRLSSGHAAFILIY